MTAAAIVLRLARPADAQTLALLSRDLIETGLRWRYRPERIEGLIRRVDTTVLVAAHGVRIVGFAVMEFGDERAHLLLLAVRPEQQRRGLGQRMLDWLIESAQVAGMASVHLELRESNQQALRFYRRLGFATTLRVSGYYEGRETAMRMLRLLRLPPATQA